MTCRRYLFQAVLLGLAVALPSGAYPQTRAADSGLLVYHIDLRDRADDRLHVRLEVNGLPPGSDVLQFAATAPGTYQVMDVGRFVEGLRAVDGDGRAIPVERVTTNQWRISDPSAVREVTYSVGDTWDTEIREHRIYPMCGTSIEADHVLLNANASIAFPLGMQDAPIRLDLEVPAGWTVGTALKQDESGMYVAEDYDFLVDSPILAGNLTVAGTEVGAAPVEIYTYAESGTITSAMLLESMKSMLEASAQFLGELPVDRYVFLYHFEGTPRPGVSYGAWEHSYSSAYTFPEVPYTEGYAQALTDVAAHEFLHVVTPLNIHSEIIEHFNFETPVPSRHLWLYEGTTEWEAHAAQMRAGLKTPQAFLDEMARKIAADRAQYDPDYSLERLALTSYTDEGQAQYGNIYMRGAVVASLLDIRLIELSDGELGLQGLIQRLMQRYGKSKPFPDDGLYDVITEMTYPQIGDFFAKYVRAAEPLPIAEYYHKLGITFVDDPMPAFTIDPEPTPAQARLRAAWAGGEAGTGR